MTSHDQLSKNLSRSDLRCLVVPNLAARRAIGRLAAFFDLLTQKWHALRRLPGDPIPSRGGMMAKNIEILARKLGATVVDKVPETSAGAFGIAALASILSQRLAPSVGKRPGRPSYAAWSKRPKVPMAPETEARLRELSHLLSEGERQVSPMQVAALILEQATASYFHLAPPSKRKSAG
jgi:hypothetical protein